MGTASVARRGLAAVRLVLRDRLLQVAVFRAPERARLVERGEALLRTGEIAGLQVELARVFERAAVPGVDAQRFVVELLGSREIGRRALAQAVAHQVVPVGVAGVVDALELVDRAGEVSSRRFARARRRACRARAAGWAGCRRQRRGLWASNEAAECLDYLFIDEAGQMALSHALAASRSARNVVLLGDPQQLEQPTKGAHPDGADVAALVHVLDKDQATLRDEQGLFLDRTYRLHPEICMFTSDLYYESRLLPVGGLERQKLGGETPFAGAGLFLVEVPHEGNQAQSNEEAEAVTLIVQNLLRLGTTWTDRDDRTRALEPRDVLVVAPYNAQVSALRRQLSPFEVTRVGTVDKFQGQEAPVVIYSCTASSPQDAPRGMSFLYDPNRFNVATSRARGVVIVVANPHLFEPDCRTPEQMLWANGLCRYRELAKAITIAQMT